MVTTAGGIAINPIKRSLNKNSSIYTFSIQIQTGCPYMQSNNNLIIE